MLVRCCCLWRRGPATPEPTMSAPQRDLTLAKEPEVRSLPVALSVRAFCQAYSVGRSLAYQLIADGSLVARKAGAKTLIDRSSAERWYNSLPGYEPAPRIVKMRARLMG